MSWRKAVTHQVIGWALLCLAFGPPLAAEGYRFEKIRVPGSVETQAMGINARGDVVGLYVDRDGVSHSYLLRKGVYTTIDVPGAVDTGGARAINARGDIVGYFFSADGASHGYLLSDGVFTEIDYPGATNTRAFGINNAGDVVGITDAPEGGFIRRNGNFRPVDVPGGFEYVRASQDNGRVVAGTRDWDDGGSSGFVGRVGGGFTAIDFPDTFRCTGVRSINQRGDLAGIFTCYGPHGFVLRDGQFTQIDFPGAVETEAWAINDDGVVVGHYTTGSGRIRGFKAVPID